ncbi:MAG: undecaprenyldiphospho-muramoylpentapeptide beta-N-acetylglucosaminyltransferase [Bacteroidetes bacterium]|jgi:UDP-N-acetylglucosamine--N-acetylmuramyl-(pentapeptide) pyrophosphoryl-undecaprenol N-acetylglucosamine transferase|nr:undecaprenyldiphospho-muramoylpentapeptide beta-N-acetylglucosaminyltransferase [Bacteroidota bacterium]
MSKSKHSEISTAHRFILSGGGTGGHLFPAIAIANQLKAKFPDAEFLFVGAKGKMEMEKVPLSGYEIKGLWISGFQRNELWRNLNLPFKLLDSFIKSRRIIKKFKPTVAIGTGGYASFPLLFMASRNNIPTLIQEQNFFPGISNKLLAKHVDKVCTVYPGMEKYFPKEKIVITGNPIRADIQLSTQNKDKYYEIFGFDKNKKTLLVIGGSLGAKTINQAILSGIDYLKEKDIQLIWQTGRYYDELTEIHGVETCKNCWIGSFINNMGVAYSIADLVVSRAGAISISELAVLGKASILIPSPNVAEDHQTKNAMALADGKASLVLNDKEAVEKLIPMVLNTINSDHVLNELSKNIENFARPESTSEIVKEVEKLIQTK